jgi:dUTPase
VNTQTINRSDTPKWIQSGDRIAQIIFQPYSTGDLYPISASEALATERGTSGFGSTGG